MSRRKYSPDEISTAVVMIRQYGGLSAEAIHAVQVALDAPGLSKSTLHGWLKTSSPDSERTEPNQRTEPKKAAPVRVVKPVTEIADDTPLDTIFELVARKYLTHALNDKVMEGVKGKDAVMAAAIATDKWRLLNNLPTEIIDTLPLIQRLYEVAIAARLDPATLFERMIQRVHDKHIAGNNGQ